MTYLSPLSAPGRCLPLWRVLAVVWAIAGVMCVGKSQAQAVAEASVSQARNPASSHCRHLIAQFDVAWPTHQKAAHAARGHKSRDLGETQCNAGHYAEGVRTLKQALHDIGVKAVRTSPAH